ncbi:hypothetical protein [Actinomadura macra]|uniref:hypothetical protein n=1 Tax=Actinomadura macra TaxID=46164 RepID=UPI000AC001A9|nr:hypothetical protein [Actinomadura macra]
MSAENPHIGARLRTERKKRGLVVADLAALFREVAPDRVAATLPTRRNIERTIRGHEAGEHGVGPRYRLLYAAALKMTEEELFPVPPQEPTAAPRGTVALGSIPDLWDDDVNRRELLYDSGAWAAGAAIAPILASLNRAWQASQRALPGASVSREMIDDWENGYDVHAASWRHDHPSTVLAALAADWSDIAPHLRRTQPDAVARDLAHAAARLAFLIAGGLSEAGDRRHSRRWWDTSRHLADKSQDQKLASQSRSFEATMRLNDEREDPGALILLAQEARRLAGTRPSIARIYAVAVEAEAHAADGDLASAITDVREVEALFSRLPASESPWGEDRLRYIQSMIYAWAGDVKRASEAHSAAQTYYGSSDHQAVQLHLHVPLVRARTETESALTQALEIIDALPAERRIARVRGNARRIITVIPEQAQALPAARELRALTVGI